MEENLVSENNKEFLDDVSPSRLQHCISELFLSMFSRNEDKTSLCKNLEKKIKAYSKNATIKIFDPQEIQVDKTV